jgi:hypothetical protein
MKKNYVNAFCETLRNLHKQYPTQNIGRHLDAALADYNLFGISDKELSYAMDKYISTLEIDPIASEAEVDRLIRETDRIFSSQDFSFEDEEEEEF